MAKHNPIAEEEADDAIEALLLRDDFKDVIAVQTRLMLEMRDLLAVIAERLPRVPTEDDSEGGPR